MRPRVLIVDDDIERGHVLEDVLDRAFDIQHARGLDDAFEALGQGPWEAALVDYDLASGGSGLELLQALRDFSSRTWRVLYTVHYSHGLRRDAERLAAVHAVLDARQPEFLLRMRATLLDLVGRVDSRALHPPAMSADANAWVSVAPVSGEFIARVRGAAEGDCPTFLYGDVGTGKSFAAGLFQQWRLAWSWRRGTERTEGAAKSAVVLIYVPTLRERIQDLPQLAEQFLERHARTSGEARKHLSNSALEDLMSREWRGNVRELNGVMLRACQRAGTRAAIGFSDLPGDAHPAWRPSQYAKDEGQRDCVLRQLRTAGSVSGAARLEGVSRPNYIRLMHRLGIVRADTQPQGETEGEDGA